MRSTCGVSIPATTWAFVTTRPLPGDPARALDPEPAGVADDAHDAERRAAHARRVENGRVGRLDAGRRAGERGERVDLRERVDQAVRRQLLVEPREDRRVLRVVAEIGLPGEIEEHGADGPAEREAGDRAEDAATDVVEEAKRAEHDEESGAGAVRPASRAPGRARRTPSRRRARRAAASAQSRRRRATARRARRGRSRSRARRARTRRRRAPAGSRQARSATMSASAIRSKTDTPPGSHEVGAPLRRRDDCARSSHPIRKPPLQSARPTGA